MQNYLQGRKEERKNQRRDEKEEKNGRGKKLKIIGFSFNLYCNKIIF